MSQFRLTRDVPQSECPWLDSDLAKGTVVTRYSGCTYGCISPAGIAVTLADDGSFMEVPRAALEPLSPRD